MFLAQANSPDININEVLRFSLLFTVAIILLWIVLDLVKAKLKKAEAQEEARQAEKKETAKRIKGKKFGVMVRTKDGKSTVMETLVIKRLCELGGFVSPISNGSIADFLNQEHYMKRNEEIQYLVSCILMESRHRHLLDVRIHKKTDTGYLTIAGDIPSSAAMNDITLAVASILSEAIGREQEATPVADCKSA